MGKVLLTYVYSKGVPESYSMTWGREGVGVTGLLKKFYFFDFYM